MKCEIPSTSCNHALEGNTASDEGEPEDNDGLVDDDQILPGAHPNGHGVLHTHPDGGDESSLMDEDTLDSDGQQTTQNILKGEQDEDIKKYELNIKGRFNREVYKQN